MDHIVRAFPLLPGKRSEFQAFAKELRDRGTEASRFYSDHGVVRETWHLQETPAGDLVIVCTDIGNATDGGARYAAATAPFEAWFKSRVLELTGIDPNTKPLGPDCVAAFEWPPASSD